MPYKDEWDNKLMGAVIFWGLYIIGTISLIGVIIWVAYHFISKYW